LIKYHKLPGDVAKPYICTERYEWKSARYGKKVVIEEGDDSDGASGAFDIYSSAWFIHDNLCDNAVWNDGTPCTAWMAAQTIGDVLSQEGRWARARYWRWMTFIFGCKKTRSNGWF